MLSKQIVFCWCLSVFLFFSNSGCWFRFSCILFNFFIGFRLFSLAVCLSVGWLVVSYSEMFMPFVFIYCITIYIYTRIKIQTRSDSILCFWSLSINIIVFFLYFMLARNKNRRNKKKCLKFFLFGLKIVAFCVDFALLFCSNKTEQKSFETKMEKRTTSQINRYSIMVLDGFSHYVKIGSARKCCINNGVRA